MISQPDLTTNIAKLSLMISVKSITKLQKSNSQMWTRLDTLFQTHWLEACQTLTTCPWTQLVSPCFKTHSVSSSEAQDKLMLSMSTQMDLTSLWPINLSNSISKCQVEESTVLEKDKESSPSFQEHGPCGPTEEKLHMMMEVEESKHTVFIHSLLSKLKPKMSGWESSSETPTPCHHLLPRNKTVILLWPTSQPVVNSRCTSSPKEAQKKSSKHTTTWLEDQLLLHSGQWDGKQPPTITRISPLMTKLSRLTKTQRFHLRVFSLIFLILLMELTSLWTRLRSQILRLGLKIFTKTTKNLPSSSMAVFLPMI